MADLGGAHPARAPPPLLKPKQKKILTHKCVGFSPPPPPTYQLFGDLLDFRGWRRSEKNSVLCPPPFLSWIRPCVQVMGNEHRYMYPLILYELIGGAILSIIFLVNLILIDLRSYIRQGRAFDAGCMRKR